MVEASTNVQSLSLDFVGVRITMRLHLYLLGLSPDFEVELTAGLCWSSLRSSVSFPPPNPRDICYVA